MDEIDTTTRINREGLAVSSLENRVRAEPRPRSRLAAHDRLTVGVRYVLQPRLAVFSQTMTGRRLCPGLNVRLLHTRSSIMRLALQLWNAETGEPVRTSIAETTMAKEAFSQTRYI